MTGNRKDFLYIRKKLKKLERLGFKYDCWPSPEIDFSDWNMRLDSLIIDENTDNRKECVIVSHSKWKVHVRMNPTYRFFPVNDWDERENCESKYHNGNNKIPKDVKDTVVNLIRAHVDDLCCQFEVGVYKKTHEKYAGVEFGNGAKQFPKQSSDFNIVWRKVDRH